MAAVPSTASSRTLNAPERFAALTCASAALAAALLVVFQTRIGPVVIPFGDGRGVHAGDLVGVPLGWLAYRLGALGARGR